MEQRGGPGVEGGTSNALPRRFGALNELGLPHEKRSGKRVGVLEHVEPGLLALVHRPGAGQRAAGDEVAYVQQIERVRVRPARLGIDEELVDIVLDQTELGAVVAADGLVVIRRTGQLEGTSPLQRQHAEAAHSAGLFLALQDELIEVVRGDLILGCAGPYEMLFVEVAPSDAPEVDDDEQRDGCLHPPARHLAAAIGHERAAGQKDEEQRAQHLGLKRSLARLALLVDIISHGRGDARVVGRYVRLLRQQLLRDLRLFIRALEVEERPAEEPEHRQQRGHARRRGVGGLLTAGRRIAAGRLQPERRKHRE